MACCCCWGYRHRYRERHQEAGRRPAAVPATCHCRCSWVPTLALQPPTVSAALAETQCPLSATDRQPRRPDTARERPKRFPRERQGRSSCLLDELLLLGRRRHLQQRFVLVVLAAMRKSSCLLAALT